MNTKELKSTKLYKEYSLEIPYEEIDSEVDNKINQILPTVNIPGFRKGKAPLNIVKKKYEDNVLNEVIQKVIDINTKKLIEEKKFSLFRAPKVELSNYEKNKPVTINLKFDLKPEIKLKDFKDLKINKYEIELDKKAEEDQFKSFIASQKNFKKIESSRQVKNTDKVIVNYRDENFKQKELEADDLLGVCIQHEIDHLNGILFIDHLSRIKKEMILKKIKKENLNENRS